MMISAGRAMMMRDSAAYEDRKRIEEREAEIKRLEAVVVLLERVASDRWKDLKACEKLNRQLEKALKGLHYVVASDPKGVPHHLRADVRRAEVVLETVAAIKRARRS